MVKLQLVLVVLLVLLHSSGGGLLDWWRGTSDESDGHKLGKVYIEVLTPRGVRLWTHHNPDTVEFAVELYVKYYGGQTEALECGMCNATARLVDGKFMLENDNLVARFGDVLEYTVVTSDGSTAKRHPVRRVFVREELIKPTDHCVCHHQAPPVQLSTGTQLSEKQLLERMIHRTLSDRGEFCEALSNWLVLRSEPRNEQADLDEYVRLYLDLLYLRSKKTFPGHGIVWSPSSTVLKVEDHADGIAFQVRSILDKLKMLEPMSAGEILTDFDGIL